MMLYRRAASAFLALGALVATDMLIPSASLLGPAPAHAIVGAPLSPVSVAGVARRTTRRAVVATSAAAPPPTTVVVQAPPPVAAPAPAPAAAPPAPPPPAPK